MELSVDRTSLLRALSRVQGIIEKRSNMPILSMIVLEASQGQLQICATDLQITFRQTVEANIAQDGSIATHGRKLFEILRESESENVKIGSMENNWVWIYDGSANFKLAGLPSEEYPTQIEPSDVKLVEIDGAVLSEMITKTIYAVTVDEAAFKLSGIYAERLQESENSILRMVGTDGHRLSLIDKVIPNLDQLELANGVMIPKKGMNEVNRLASEGGTISLGFKQNNCIVKKDGASIVIRLLDAKFPDYRAVIPESPQHRFNVERLFLLQAMKKMLILSSERYKAVKIRVGDGLLDLHSTNPDLGEADEKVPVDYSGEPFELAFNARYFIDVLQNMESELVELGFVDDTKPCVIKGELDEGFLGLIMPMRI